MKRCNVKKHIRKTRKGKSVIRQHRRKVNRGAKPGEYGYGTSWGDDKWREELSDVKNKKGHRVLVPIREERTTPRHYVDLNQGQLSIRKDKKEEGLFEAVKLARKHASSAGYGEHNALLQLVTSKNNLKDDVVHWDRAYYVKPKNPILMRDYLKKKGHDVDKFLKDRGAMPFKNRGATDDGGMGDISNMIVQRRKNREKWSKEIAKTSIKLDKLSNGSNPKQQKELVERIKYLKKRRDVFG